METELIQITTTRSYLYTFTTKLKSNTEWVVSWQRMKLLLGGLLFRSR